MSDVFWPRICDDFNLEIIGFVPQVNYLVRTGLGDDACRVFDLVGRVNRKDKEYAILPKRYEVHLQRFFWRQYVIHILLAKLDPDEIYLKKAFRSFLKSLLELMDTVLEQLLRHYHDGRSVSPPVPYFEYYLATEYLVGRHDPESVGKWRADPENFHEELEQIDPFQLDWECYDNALGDFLGGRSLGYSVDRIQPQSSRHLIKYVLALKDWYGLKKEEVLTSRASKEFTTDHITGVIGQAGNIGSEKQYDELEEGEIEEQLMKMEE